MTVLVIAANSLRRLTRERSQLFFVFVLPLMLILVLGLTVASDEPRIGVHAEGDGSPAARALIADLEQLDGVAVEEFGDLGAASDELEREDITALIIVPEGFDEDVSSGVSAGLEYRVIPGSGGLEVQSLVQSVVADQNATIRAGRLVSEQTGLPSDAAALQVSTVAEGLVTVEVVTVDPDGDAYLSRDAVGFIAAQELILFVFLIGMIAASALIKSRQLGVTRRMLATPATTSQVIAGEALGRFAVAVVQSIFISFSLVATAAAMFIGALVSNESQSSAIGISLGLGFAALGGCMVPFEIFPDWLRTVAHITPHAWAIDAFTEVIQRGGGLGQIGVELAVLTLFGVTLLTAASFTLRRAIIE